MAAPNLKAPSTIYGKSVGASVTTSLAAVLTNAAASGKVYKVNTIRAGNVTSGGATLDVTFYRGSTHTYIVKNADVGPSTFFVINDKNEYIYLEEGDSIYAKANVGTTIDLLINYEEVN